MVFYKCIKCGKVVEEIINQNTRMTCCGQGLLELKANEVDASEEKHIPVLTINNNVVAVTIGSDLHPMEDNHYIVFICLETNEGIYNRILKPGDTPFAEFTLKVNESIINTYAYCNIHGLWKREGK